MKALKEKLNKKDFNNKICINNLVYAKILPKNKGVYKAVYEGPFIVVNISGNSCLTLRNIKNGKIIIRNIQHVKKISSANNEYDQKKIKYVVED